MGNPGPADLPDHPPILPGEEATRTAPPRRAPEPGGGVRVASSLRGGDRVGRYRLESPVGRGGMGLVWRAVDDHGRRVAVKFLLVDNGLSPDSVPDEFTIPSMVQHPHILSVESIGRHEIDGRVVPWIAMEYLSGARTLTEWVADGKQPAIVRLRLLSSITEAIAVLHGLGAIHLDLKPGNILVDRHAHPRLIDFGIARTLLHAPEGPVGGTRGYAAPEQFQHGPVTARADVRALGVVIHETLTGRKPSVGEVATHPSRPPRRLAGAAPGLEDEIPHLLPHLDRVIAACLQDAPDRRPEQCGLVRDALEAIIESHGRPNEVGSFMREHPRLWRLGMRATVVAVAAAAAWLLSVVIAAMTTAPVRFAAGLMPAPPGSVAARDALEDVLLVRIPAPSTPPAGSGVAMLRALESRAGVDGPRGALRSDAAVRDQRPWIGEGIDLLSAAGAASIAVGIRFITGAPGEGGDGGGTARVVAGIRAASARGVTTTIARSNIADSTELDSDIAAATTYHGHNQMAESPGGSFTVDTVVTRDQSIVGGSLAGATVVARLGGTGSLPDDLDLGPDDAPRFDPKRSPGKDGITLPERMFTGSEELRVGRFTDGTRVGVEDGDRSHFSSVRLPSENALTAATIDLTDVFDLEPHLLAERVRGRIVLLYTATDVDGPVQAVLIEDMLRGSTIQIPIHPNLGLTVLAGIVGGGVATAWPRSRRRHEAIALGVLAVTAVVAIMAIPLAMDGQFVYPLPAFLGGCLATGVAASRVHPVRVLRFLGIDTHRPPTFTLGQAEKTP